MFCSGGAAGGIKKLLNDTKIVSFNSSVILSALCKNKGLSIFKALKSYFLRFLSKVKPPMLKSDIVAGSGT